MLSIKIGLTLVLMVAVTGLVYSYTNYQEIKQMPEGTSRMKRTAKAIREGANAFLSREWEEMRIVIFVLALIFGIFIQWESALAFILGAFGCRYAAVIGLKAVTYANVRVTNMARLFRDKGKCTQVGIKGGSIPGFIKVCSTLLGLVVIFHIFDYQFEKVDMTKNWIDIVFSPFCMTLTTYGFGNSLVALYMRVGGGMFTKAADMGADLVGKVEKGIPEDHYLNPATIADNVGDGVGDSAGLGCDTKESYAAAMITPALLLNIIFCKFVAVGMHLPMETYKLMCVYPLYFGAIGVIASLVGVLYLLRERTNTQKVDPRVELAKLVAIAAGGTIFGTAILTHFMFRGVDFGDLPIHMGYMTMYFVTLIGIVAGLVIAAIFNYYTSTKDAPVIGIAESGKQGSGIALTSTLAVAFKSTLAIAVVIVISLITTNSMASILGATYAAVGMLSFSPVVLAIDVFGPISDNAGGIAEMCGLNKNVRAITDEMDETGNSTAAIGKGFSIASAAFSAIAMMICFIYSVSPIEEDVVLNILDSTVLAGGIFGVGITMYFSGMIIGSVSELANKMVIDVQKQMNTIPGLREALEKVSEKMKKNEEQEEDEDDEVGDVRPNYDECVALATEGALHEMKKPAILAIVVPVACGFIFGPSFVEGFIIVAVVAATLLAVFSANFGGAADNAKKLVESMGLKGTPQHKALVVCDTVGDPLKDTQGPSLNILIKSMNMINIIAGPAYAKVNLAIIIAEIFK